MMTSLQLAGLLGRIRGFVFGSCSKCEPGGEGYGSLTLEEVLDEHVRPLGVPAYEGALIGHQERQFTVPVGIEVEIDASAGSITMLEPAVT
jgi:muramoyltetrapeptide carboxypeptidase